jgi:hypothetical protein
MHLPAIAVWEPPQQFSTWEVEKPAILENRACGSMHLPAIAVWEPPQQFSTWEG